MVYSTFGKYTGEVNDRGHAHGEGKWTDTGKIQTYQGTFKDGQISGYCK